MIESQHVELTKRLVLVDDDDVEALILKRYLVKVRDDVQLAVFRSGEAFLEYMDQARSDPALLPDLVLLDARMPGMDGFEVLKQLREDTGLDGSPRIVMFSNSRDEIDIERALKLGAAAYQPKPMGGDEYLEFLAGIEFVN